MRTLLLFLVRWFLTTLRPRVSLQLEVLALRHQLAVYQRTCRRPHISPADRLLWSYLARVWSGWREQLFFVKPATIIAWQRKRFRDHWRQLSQPGTPGRPAITKELRELIRRMSRANPTWGSPRIVGELAKLGIEEAPIGPRAPWQSPYVERLIGSIRRECLNHVIILNERHLKRVLVSYFNYYHRWWVHRSLDMDSPEPRPVQPPELGEVVELPDVGELHHHYERRVA